jgi:hypothetical protein
VSRAGRADRTIQFGMFELSPQSSELRRAGVRIKLQDQPFKLLTALLEHPSEIVTREELQRSICPTESFGDFDHALNADVAKRRAALCDSAESPLLSAIHLNSLARLPALCHLSSTDFARHLFTTCSRAGGVIGLMLLIGVGSLSRIAETMLNLLLPSNAFRPLSISYKIAPSEKISLRASSSFPSTCFGDIYWNVPMIVPSCVTGDGGICAVNVISLSNVADGFARPKSRSFVPLPVSMMFPGFKSR